MSSPDLEPDGRRGAIPAEPLVSVVIPAYNAEQYVLEAIRSVLDQGYQAMEVLLIDDGSQDGTTDLVRRAAPQVRIIQQPNAGVAAARNTGLRHAAGDFICLLDADDGWFPGKVAAQLDYLQRHPEVGLVFHDWYVWKPDQTGAYIPPRGLPVPTPGEIDLAASGWIYPQLLLDCIVHTSTVMMRREVARTIGFFDPKLVSGEDYDYWLHVSRRYQMHKLRGIYSYYRAVAGSLTSVPKTENYEYCVVKKAIDQWGLSSPDGASVSKTLIDKRLSKLAFDYGYGHYHRGSSRLAEAAFVDALRHQPLRWRALLYLVAVHSKRLFKFS